MKYMLFFSFLYSFLVPLHEFHLSKCEIAYNETAQTLEVTLHLFIDDLELGMAEEGLKDLYICTDREAPQAEQYIARYLKNHFTLQIDGEEQDYAFLGKEVSEDLQAVWCYLEIEDISAIEELSIRNQILLKIFADQRNIVSIKSSTEGRKGYFLFDNKHFEDTIKF